jgi:predicted transcriptional regulator
VKRFPEKLDAIERKAEHVVQLAREAKEIARALKQLLEKDGKTPEEERRIAELYDAVQERAPRARELHHRTVDELSKVLAELLAQTH